MAPGASARSCAIAPPPAGSASGRGSRRISDRGWPCRFPRDRVHALGISAVPQALMENAGLRRRRGWIAPVAIVLIGTATSCVAYLLADADDDRRVRNA